MVSKPSTAVNPHQGLVDTKPDMSLQSETATEEPEAAAPVEETEAVESDVVAEAEAVVEEAAAEDEVEEIEEVEEEVVEAPAPKAKAAKKPAANKKPTTAQAVDALVTTITSMAESVSTLSNTVDALSAKVATPPAPVIVEAPAPVEEVVAEEEVVEEKPSTLGSVALQTLGNLGTFVGVGLVAAAAMRPNFDTVSLIMAPIGIIVFLLNALFIDRDKDVEGIKGLVLHGAMSVLAVVAIGLLVGGIQRFGDDPHRGAVLIPLGAALFLIFSAYKMRTRLESQHLVWMAGAGVWICLFLGIGLHAVANNVDAKPVTHHTSVPAPAAAHEEVATTVAPASEEHGAAAATDEHATETTETTETTLAGGTHMDNGIMVIGSGESTSTTVAESAHDSTPTTSDPHQSTIDEAVKAGDEAAAKAGH